jgi:enamine deaminase RidA (YjgF/YER057c/UK114 family)
MTDIQRLHPTVRMHQAVIHAGTVYTAGQVAQDNPGASIAVQTAEVLQRVDDLLTEAGTNKSRILTAYVYLADIADFDEMNTAWDAWVAQDAKPARTTIEAKLTEAHYGVEVGVIAAI